MASTFPEIAAAHAAAQPILRQAEERLVGWIGVVCNDISMDRRDTAWVRISGEARVKDAYSLERALDEAGLDADGILQIDDLVGARAVVLRLSDADKLADEIMTSTTVRLEGAASNKIHDQHTGYRAIHIKGWMTFEGQKVGCEIQIRTELQDAWAVVSRTDLYKVEETAEVVIAAARIQADHLASHDDFFELIPTLAILPPTPELTVGPKKDESNG